MSKEKRKPRPDEARRLSLHPLSLEEALKGAMETGPPPESPRQRKPRKKVKKSRSQTDDT